MPVKREMIGVALTPVTFEIERGKIREFALATGDLNPIYHDLTAARAAGYVDLPIPPTFPTTFMRWGRKPSGTPPEDLGFPHARVLHGEEEYTYLAPIYPGDTLTGIQSLIDVKERNGKLGVMEIATLETVFTNQDGQEVLRARTVAVVPPTELAPSELAPSEPERSQS